MEEIKVGEYVRTKKGKIFKYGKGRAYLGKDNEIVKHSFNITDLIEEGDIVNGYRILDIADSIYKNSKRILIFRDAREEKWIYIQEFDGKIHTQDDIKTIITKEQMEVNQYVV